MDKERLSQNTAILMQGVLSNMSVVKSQAWLNEKQDGEKVSNGMKLVNDMSYLATCIEKQVDYHANK